MKLENFTYDKIASKLSSFVSKKQKVRIIVFFSPLDPGRDKANLTFLKHFGVVPEEFDISKDDSAINILSSLKGFDGMTIIVESVFINNLLLNDTVTKNENYDSVSIMPVKYQHLFRTQIEKISHCLMTNRYNFTGGYVYISGFSVVLSSADKDSLPNAEFLPWYLEVDNKTSLCRVVRQPELSFLIKEMTEAEPLIHNLDDYLDEMNN